MPVGHLGEHIIKHWGAELPFLLKVLSTCSMVCVVLCVLCVCCLCGVWCVVFGVLYVVWVLCVCTKRMCLLSTCVGVAQALSIQAHPDIERAKMLHKNKPSIYKVPSAHLHNTYIHNTHTYIHTTHTCIHTQTHTTATHLSGRILITSPSSRSPCRPLRRCVSSAPPRRSAT